MDSRRDIASEKAFWDIRSANYDKLYWTRDESYLADICRLSDLREEHLVLDVGTGTGAIAKASNQHVRHVVAIDISDSMLEKGRWSGMSVIKWDIGESFFADGIFDRVIARMVFHHILDNLDRAILRCYDLLKPGGKITVAEGVPPVDDPDVVEWYTGMFRLKEERRTFTPAMLVHYLEKNGFKNVACHEHYMDDFSIGNWIGNSGLDQGIQNEMMEIHRNAPQKIKDVYDMRITDDDCIIRSKSVIVVGDKKST